MSRLANAFQGSQEPPVPFKSEPRQVRADSLLGQWEIQYFLTKTKKPPSRVHFHAFAAINRARAIIQIRNAAAADIEETRQEMEWVREHAREYAGHWIAVKRNDLLAVGESAADVYAKIGQRADTPMVTRIPEDDELPFAGW
jgi:uncharacterized protein DUF5678